MTDMRAPEAFWSVPEAELLHGLSTSARGLARIEAMPAEKLDDLKIREERAKSHFLLGNLEPALADFDYLISSSMTTGAAQAIAMPRPTATTRSAETRFSHG